ncbi:hypothetical protein OZY48_06370 [Aliarcobacter cryaerophilus]|uniref:hypothetical protein n=1 Tax=Aliarcobacter cryaerophilus TaxID=28198 RepID=UPI003BAEDC09
MKVLYVSSMRDFFSGAKKQIKWEIEAAKNLKIDWELRVIHDGKIENDNYEVNPPKIFRNILLRNLFTWMYIIKIQKDYDVIINRHITFDIFVVFLGWFVKNRFSVHHGKEVYGLKVVRKNWKGKIASFIESLTGYISLKQVKGCICVTEDIEKYQYKRAGIKTFLYPNGINVDDTLLFADNRNDKEINIAFVCSIFSEWHGLDLLIDNINKNKAFIQCNNIKIHLIGKITEKNLKKIQEITENESIIYKYGHISQNEYESILEKCDIGLDSLALYREGLIEGSALKVREYLAGGLAVYSCYRDSALKEDFEYYKIGDLNIKEIYNFAMKIKSVSRKEIRNKSINYISKSILLKKLYLDIEKFMITEK